MAQEFYGFFDSVSGDTRSYNQLNLSQGFRIMSDSGVATLDDDNLKVFPADSGLRTRVNYGGALVFGYPYALTDDGGSPKVVDHPLAVSYPRIDRVVLRLNLDGDARNITLVALEGVEAANPEPPELTRSGTIYEISLAQCLVRPSQTIFQEADITDERGDASVCGDIRGADKDAQEALAEAQQALASASAAQESASAAQASADSAQQTADSVGEGLATLSATVDALSITEGDILWSGSWTAGSITVPDLDRYDVLVAIGGSGFQAVMTRDPGINYFAGTGSIAGASVNRIDLVSLLCVANGNVLTMDRDRYITISATGNTANGPLPITQLRGLVIKKGE